MQPGPPQRDGDEGREPHVAVIRAEVFDTVGIPLLTSWAKGAGIVTIAFRRGAAPKRTANAGTAARSTQPLACRRCCSRRSSPTTTAASMAIAQNGRYIHQKHECP